MYFVHYTIQIVTLVISFYMKNMKILSRWI